MQAATYGLGSGPVTNNGTLVFSQAATGAGVNGTFTNAIGGRTVTNTVVPRYRFVWQVQGVVDTVSDRSDTVVALLDYATGGVLYDVRDNLRPADLVREPTATPHPSGSPQTELKPTASPAPSGTP